MRTRSLALFLAKSSMVPAVAAIALLAASSASATDPVYRWKDANGQSHYSQQPPEKGVKYETIASSGAPASAAAATPAHGESAPAPKNPAASPANANGATPAQNERQRLCETARKNVDVLTNRPLVEMDINNTGTPVRLTPEQQTQQLDIARKQQTSYCAK